MSRRASLLQQVAWVQGRQAQIGVNTSKGYLSSTAPGLLFEGPRSLEVFFNYQRSDAYQRPVGLTADSLELEIPASNDTLVFYCGRGRVQASLVDGEDYHAVISYNGYVATAYLNGAVVGTITPVNYLTPPILNVGSGTYPPKGPVYFVRMYNYPIYLGEVTARYNSGNPSKYVLPSVFKKLVTPFPDLGYTPSNGVFLVNSLSVTTQLMNVPQANGFSGKYMRFDAVTGISLYCAYWYYYLKKLAPVKITFEYRANRTLYASQQSTAPTASDAVAIAANEGDAQIASVIYGVENYAYFFSAADPEVWVEIRVLSIEPVGCVAEYVSQNIIRDSNSWLDSAKQLPINDNYLPPLRNPIKEYEPLTLSGAVSYTWTGTEGPYNFWIPVSEKFVSGNRYRIRVTVSNYEAGTPFMYLGQSTYLPAANGTYEVEMPCTVNQNSLFIYGGPSGSDRRLTLTIENVSLVKSSYDLALASGTVDVVYKTQK